MKGYIYTITNNVNNKIYVGSTTCPTRRWAEHRRHLNSNKHINKGLQEDWSYFGESNFSFELIKEVEIDNRKYLKIYEDYYILEFKAMNPEYGYNNEIQLDMKINADKNELSQTQKKAYQNSITNGIIHTNSKLYGYTYDSINNKLIVNEKEADVVRLIYDLYLKGYGATKIINELNELNIKTRAGQAFAKTTIVNILKNPKYAGINYISYEEVDAEGDFKKAKINLNNEYEISNKIPSIISVEDFMKVQTEISNRTTEQGNGKNPGKKVICIETGQVFNSVGEANLFAKKGKNKKGDQIRKCCQGKQETAYKLHWKYKEED